MPALTPEAWTQIRYDYEHTERPVEAICAEHGISSGTLRNRMHRWRWTRRRPPIPREGPPAMAAPSSPAVSDADNATDCDRGLYLSPPCGERSASEASRVRGRIGDSEPAETPPHPDPLPASGEREPSDPASIAARLQGSVARVLPAIEASLARLAAGAQRPREMEQTARALGVLMRTLRELNALAKQQPPADDDEPPRDIDELRFELARRIHALVDAAKAREAVEMPKRLEAAWLGLGDEIVSES